MRAVPRRLSRSQHEIHVHLVIGENDAAIPGAIENARLGERLDIAVYGFHIAADTAGDLPYRDRAGAGHCSQHSSPFRRDDLP